MAEISWFFSSLIGNYLALNLSRIRVPGTPHTLISRVDSRSETPVSQFVKTGAQRGAISGHLLKFLQEFQKVKMNTRSRTKQTAATRVPPPAAVSFGDAVSEVVDPVTPVRRNTRSRMVATSSNTGTKIVPEQKLKKVPANPKVKKKVPVRQQLDTYDEEEFVDLEDLEDPEIESDDTTPKSDGEFQLEMDKLKQRMAELETLRVNPQQSQKRTEVTREVASGSYREPNLPVKLMNPVEGRDVGHLQWEN